VVRPEVVGTVVGLAQGGASRQQYLNHILRCTSDSAEQLYLLCVYHMQTGNSDDESLRRMYEQARRELDQRRVDGSTRRVRRYIDKLVEHGHSAAAIARAMGVKYERARRRCVKQRGARAYRQLIAEEEQQIADMLTRGCSVREVARTLGRHVSTVWYYAKRQGLL